MGEPETCPTSGIVAYNWSVKATHSCWLLNESLLLTLTPQTTHYSHVYATGVFGLAVETWSGLFPMLFLVGALTLFPNGRSAAKS